MWSEHPARPGLSIMLRLSIPFLSSSFFLSCLYIGSCLATTVIIITNSAWWSLSFIRGHAGQHGFGPTSDLRHVRSGAKNDLANRPVSIICRSAQLETFNSTLCTYISCPLDYLFINLSVIIISLLLTLISFSILHFHCRSCNAMPVLNLIWTKTI